MTPRGGNILDVDGRYFKTITYGVEVMLDVINMALKKHDTVLVRNIPGNHDPNACVALTVALNAFFRNDERVTIDLDPSDFFYHRFGNTLIGANHGHRLKPVNMAMHMANTRPEDWGKSKFRYFYFGHIHHKTMKEEGGVITESFQTLSAKDAYHAGGGYLGGRSLTGITIHKDKGEIGRHIVSV